jgi:hypothetical protein
MKTTKLLAIAAIVPLCVGVTSASATTKKKKPPKPVCNLIKDANNDATGTGTGTAGPYDANLDILSADIATNATTATFVVRLAAMDANDNNAPTGAAFEFAFTAPTGPGDSRAIVGPAGDKWPATTGVKDTAKKEIRWSVPLSSFSKLNLKPGVKLTGLTVSSWRWVSPSDVVLGQVDTGTTNSTYTTGSPSCVKVGA